MQTIFSRHAANPSALSRCAARMVLAGVLGIVSLVAPALATAHDRDKEHRTRHSLVRYPHGIPGTVEALTKQVADLQAQLTAMSNSYSSLQTAWNTAQATVVALQTRVAALEANGSGGGGGSPLLTDLSKYLTIDQNTLNGVRGPHIIFTGVNVHVRSGSGSTDDAQSANGQPVGLGNLIVGYNELNPTGGLRSGSHNIVGGSFNNFSSVGGLVVGVRNAVSGQYASVHGGDMNMASG